MKRNKTSGVQQQEGRRPENEQILYIYIYNEGTIIVNTDCKKHVVLLTNNVMEHANKYIKKKQIRTLHDMLPQHLVYKNELNREYVVTLVRKDETP